MQQELEVLDAGGYGDTAAAGLLRDTVEDSRGAPTDHVASPVYVSTEVTSSRGYVQPGDSELYGQNGLGNDELEGCSGCGAGDGGGGSSGGSGNGCGVLCGVRLPDPVGVVGGLLSDAG